MVYVHYKNYQMSNVTPEETLRSIARIHQCWEPRFFDDTL